MRRRPTATALAELLDAAVERARASVPTERTLLSGDPAGTLANESADLGALVMGSRGHGPLGRILLSSVSAELMRSPVCPLFVVPRQDTHRVSGPLLICFDGSDSARHAVAEAGRLFRNGPAIVLHVYQSLLAFTPGYPLAGFSGGGEVSEDLEKEAGARAQALVDEGAELARAAGMEAIGHAELTSDPPGRRSSTPRVSATSPPSSWARAGSRAYAPRCWAASQTASSITATGRSSWSRPQRRARCPPHPSSSATTARPPPTPRSPAPRATPPTGPPWSSSPPSKRPPSGSAHPYDQHALDEHRGKAEAALREAAAHPALEGVTVETEMIAGKPAEVIANVARTRNAEEIVIGSRGLGPLRGALGSVAYRTLHTADRPVVVVPDINNQ